MKTRLEEEIELLRHHYGEVDYDSLSSWFRIHSYVYGEPCAPIEGPIAFQVSQGFPGAQPYGFAVPASLRFGDKPFSGSAPPSVPPYSGPWVFLSWTPEVWYPTADLLTGSNLWGWARGFAARLKEGP